MFQKILIANRGEIACRIIQTAAKFGVKTVAVYSDADALSRHVAMADEAINIGAAPARESYLVIEKVIAAAKQSGAEAIHPGYGFLSENADFCRACEANNIVFIGPSLYAIESMGSKSAAKNIMEGANIPLVPGYHGDDQTPARLKQAANKMGYPVLLKATAGGGGKGMRQVWSEEEFDQALAAAKREANNSFGDDRMLVEKYLSTPRHIEVQVFCDSQGNAVYLADRDCSVQRRHQKVIEEAPAPNLSDSLRKKMGEAAVLSAKAINYLGAGTVEFLLDADGSFYFMEMNTRLQVEHPVTEMVTGQDLVEWQLRIASGEVLPITQEQVTVTGHAFEARIYAEDPDNDFLPVSGTLAILEAPEQSANIRVDTGVRQGDQVSVYYDPMIAKLISWNQNRDLALKDLSEALAQYSIGGMTNNLHFLYNISNTAAFKAAEVDTCFIDKHHSEIFYDKEQDKQRNIVIAALYSLLSQSNSSDRENNSTRYNTRNEEQNNTDPFSPWHQKTAWRMNEACIQTITLQFKHQIYSVDAEYQASSDSYTLTLADQQYSAEGKLNNKRLTGSINQQPISASVKEQADMISIYTEHHAFEFCSYLKDYSPHDDSHQGHNLVAPMNGTIVSHAVTEGSHVKAGDALLMMEAMKMEHTIRATSDGVLTAFYYQPGDLVDGGAELIDFTADIKNDAA